MNAKVITNFAATFGVDIALNPEYIVEKAGRYYQVNAALKPLVNSDFYYAGFYLGKEKQGKFFPSFNLLNILAKKDANRIVVDKKTAWLFICGRDIMFRGILKVFGTGKRHTNVLVLNEYDECLGFGRIIRNLNDRNRLDELAVKNVSDVGDFLRRER